MCDRHPPFEPGDGDRTVSRISDTLADAMDRAVRVARARKERQRITLHDGQMLKTFHIQDRAKYDAWAAERAEVSA